MILCGAIPDHLFFIYFRGLVEVYRTGDRSLCCFLESIGLKGLVEVVTLGVVLKAAYARVGSRNLLQLHRSGQSDSRRVGERGEIREAKGPMRNVG